MNKAAFVLAVAGSVAFLGGSAAQAAPDATYVAEEAGDSYSSAVLHEEGVYALTASGSSPVTTITGHASVDPAGASAAAARGTTSGTTPSVRAGLADTRIDTAMLIWGAAGVGALGLGAGSVVIARRRAEEL